MQVKVEIICSPIEEAIQKSAQSPTAGALVEFWGTVRDDENGTAITALLYEAYAAMAERQMREILDEIAVSFPCESVRVVHRQGWVGVGEAAIYVSVRARHRGEAFGMLTSFMDRLKTDVPIWKVDTL